MLNATMNYIIRFFILPCQRFFLPAFYGTLTVSIYILYIVKVPLNCQKGVFPFMKYTTKKRMQKYAASVVCAVSIFTAVQAVPVWTAPVQAASVSQSSVQQHVESPNWDPAVKASLNQFMDMYGSRSASYDAGSRPYAVFDFDNTTSILDVEEQLMVWQLDRLAFAIEPDQMESVLRTGIPADKLTLTYGADDGDGRPVQIEAAIKDAAAAYKQLCAKGLVTKEGREQPAEVRVSPEYKEFTAKMRWLYDAIGDTMDASVSYPWVTYWYTGMTPDEVYALAYESHSFYGDPAKGQTWSKGKYVSPADFKSEAGAVSVSYKLGITVSPEMKELYKTLNDNGIDTWVDTASPVDVVRAAVDYFQVPGVDGIVGMTNKTDAQGRYINSYDYDLHAQTQGVGKSLTIDKVIAPKYNGQGPIFAAMDSQGDFNFCTEYKNTKAVLILNRQRSDDAGLCAAVAVWQKKHGITLADANKNGDTLFLLQGRNENTGTLWATDQTQLLGKTDSACLSAKAADVVSQLDAGKTVEQALEDNTKLKEYQGYKSR